MTDSTEETGQQGSGDGVVGLKGLAAEHLRLYIEKENEMERILADSFLKAVQKKSKKKEE